ncbi:hypothetical protein [Herbaspirillum sp. SJZ107]|uniref:hypothetical protein n=1 Tax=Herbaspirillum sp. SJZ107 TaxID=2572881 RepID=UPI00114EA23D|nr:hypothetical protein [Herbaspirillum sp. SJZ107]TQK03483.1 hypothetical protein FBX97_5052 [Herbaspirillum sp. SJZ107]
MEHATHAVSDEARELLDIWDRLARQHVALAGSCACSVGGVTLQLQDFEQDIVDYLLGQAERNDRADVAALLRHRGRDEDGKWSIGALLGALAGKEAPAGAGIDAPAFILTRLGKTLRSFAKLHG